MNEKYIITVLRRKSPNDEPYKQSFEFNGTGDETVAVVLDFLNFNDDLFDTDGKPAPRIGWECSCGQGVCGGCAMVINGVPALACKAKLRDCKSKEILLEPLSKFPIVRDLIVDRDCLDMIPIEHKLWLESDAISDAKQHAMQYLASKCLKCGLCVEVCPNTGDCDKNLGAFFAAECFLKKSQTNNKNDKQEAKKEYEKHFADGCSKSMSCADVCPAKIDFRKLINLMNR